MGRTLSNLVGALKDKASLTKTTLLCSTTTTTTTITPTSPHLAVLRATTHHPSPPHPHHLASILSFGHASRLAAAALVAALTTRLTTTHHPTVALKSLLTIHLILSRGAFILRDQLTAHLRPAPGHRNPLNLASFHHRPWPLSSWVRFYARVLESLFMSTRVLGRDPPTCLMHDDLIKELEALVDVVVEISLAPEVEDDGVVWEVVRLVEEDRLTAEREIVVRLKEVRERFGSLGFGGSVELVCLLRRLEGCRHRAVDGEGFWGEVTDVMKRAEEVVMREEERSREGKVRREKVGESARVSDRVLLRSSEPVRFGSSRWEPVDYLS